MVKREPQNLLNESWLEPESTDPYVVDYILNLINRLKHCQELAERRMSSQQNKRKTWYDRNAVSRKFKVGNKVLALATSKSNKMAMNWIGPGKITGVISDTSYLMDLPEKRDKNTICHVNLIKPYYCPPEYVKIIVEDNDAEIENEAVIPYPVADPTQLNF